MIQILDSDTQSLYESESVFEWKKQTITIKEHTTLISSI